MLTFTEPTRPPLRAAIERARGVLADLGAPTRDEIRTVCRQAAAGGNIFVRISILDTHQDGDGSWFAVRNGHRLPGRFASQGEAQAAASDFVIDADGRVTRK